MIIQPRTIYETFTDEQGNPIVGKTVLFKTLAIAADDNRIIVSQTVRGKTRFDGRLYDPKTNPAATLPTATDGLSLLCAADGTVKALHQVVMPDGTEESFLLTKESGGPVRLLTLVTLGSPLAIDSAAYQLFSQLSDDVAALDARVDALEAGSGHTGQPASVIDITKTASVALSGHRAVRLNVAQQFVYADNATPNTAIACGITTGSANAGAPCTARSFGLLTENSWNWTAGQPIFVGNNGLLTQVAPASGVLLEIARAVSPTTILIDIKIPLSLA